MNFFQTSQGMHCPVDQIAWIGRLQDPRPGQLIRYHTVMMNDESEHLVNAWEVERILRCDAPVIAALPGTKLLTFNAPEAANPQEWTVSAEQVIAWRMVDGEPQPITMEAGPSSSQSPQAVQFPDGTVADDMGETWSSVGDFIESARSWVISDREEGAAAA